LVSQVFIFGINDNEMTNVSNIGKTEANLTMPARDQNSKRRNEKLIQWHLTVILVA